MVRIDPRQLSDLGWQQPSAFSRQYELKTGDSQIASLDFMRAFGTLAEAKTESQAWKFERSGFIAHLVTARVAATGEEAATYEPKWLRRKGHIQLSSGESLELKSQDFRRTKWTLTSGSGELLLRLESKGMFHHGCEVTVTEACRNREDLGLLLTLTWYILVLVRRDRAAAAS